MPSRDFKPGHPILFWTFILVVIFAMYSAGVAIMTANDCDTSSGGKKEWTVIPPEWECGADDGVQLTRD